MIRKSRREGKRLIVLLAALLVLLICFSQREAFGAYEETNERFRLGAGIGVAYGLFGTNLEVRPIDYLALSGGLGIGLSGITRINWNLGARIYPLNRKTGMDPRFSAYYGKLSQKINQVPDPNENRVVNIRGYAFGPGIDFQFKNGSGIDFDWLYLKSNDFEEPGMKGEWQFSLGVRVRF